MLAGNLEREREKTITDRFQLHNMIFCFIEARQINATIIILRVGSPLYAPPVRALRSCFLPQDKTLDIILAGRK